jgi:hypothetical protein
MPFPQFDRRKLLIKKLADRKDRLFVKKDLVNIDSIPLNLSEDDTKLIALTAEKIKAAKKHQSSVIIAFGAHTIKNGLGPVLTELLKNGWVTHLATNGAGIIHDWEFAFRGSTSEDVRENIKRGEFGIWEETGFFINLALVMGAWQGLGYGESIGKMINQEGLDIPEKALLINAVHNNMESDPAYSSAALDLLAVIKVNNIKPGFMNIPHPWKRFSVQSAAYENNIPFTGHPMFGHDIIYTHPVCNGAAIGRTAAVDFLVYAKSVSNIGRGVYLSVGSSVMSPMIFEKSLSMARNIEIQKNKHIDDHFILVADLAESKWDWQQNGEPTANHPAYYLRYCKTFSRMGGEMHYLQADNRDFLLELNRCLCQLNQI